MFLNAPGLDIFQRYEIGPFSLASTAHDERLTKAFEVTFLSQTGAAKSKETAE